MEITGLNKLSIWWLGKNNLDRIVSCRFFPLWQETGWIDSKFMTDKGNTKFKILFTNKFIF
jgi:hypothetical protein